MERLKIATSYSDVNLEIERPQPLSDNKIEFLIEQLLSGSFDKNISNDIFQKFIQKTENYILNSRYNKLEGLSKFPYKNIINGCTQFIDNIYMNSKVQVFEHDYRYHQRLNYAHIVKFTEDLIPKMPLIIAMPFPSTGAIHNNMQQILKICSQRKIPVHIDGAWITCSKNINFDFSHEAIKSIGISLSKGLGLGWNRIGVRWTRKPIKDSISLMNDFNMNNKINVIVGNYFLDNLESDYLWQTHEHRYNKICKDFNLDKTNSIHLAKKQGQPVGVSPLIRYLENHEI